MMKSNPLFEKLRIFAPGPTPVPEAVLAELARSPLHHRTKEFTAILERVREGLRFLFQTKEPVYLFASSGTGAMESTVVNLFSPNDDVLVLNGGKFGERWGKICSQYGINVHWMDIEWGRVAHADQVVEKLRSGPEFRGVLFQSTETSTGVAFPVKEIAEAVHNNSDALVIVDAISALGVTDLPMDKWGLDAVVSGAQKAMMLPPGLAFLALSQRAQAQRKQSTLPKFYYNLDPEDKAYSKGQTAWTPAVSHICGLDIILKRIQTVGLAPLWKFYERLAGATRRGAQAMNLELFAKECPSPSVTAILVPPSIPDGTKIGGYLRDRYGLTIAGGQDKWKGKIFRIGHLGYYDELDVLTVLSATEMTLRKLGHDCEPGRGVGAAATYLLESE